MDTILKQRLIDLGKVEQKVQMMNNPTNDDINTALVTILNHIQKLNVKGEIPNQLQSDFVHIYVTLSKTL